MKPLFLTLLVCLLSTAVLAQVDDIKRKSAENSSRRKSESSSSGGGAVGSAIAVDVAIQSMNLFFVWQQQTLKKKEINRNITSLDIFLQTAIQPSTYYIVHPRVRANWGVISTDFRMKLPDRRRH
jgi:hypothetical protein